MKIIVVGGGKVGTALCRSLVAENHDVILIEQDEAVVNHITKRYDIIGIVGNGANFKILEQADVADCDIFVALTEQDEVNMVSAVLAKKMGAKETVVRVRNPEYSNSYFKENKLSLKARWGLGFNILSKVNKSLQTGMPVILGVGPDLLSFLKKEKGIEVKDIQTGNTAKIYAHYVLIYDCKKENGEDFFYISSWGRGYKLAYSDFIRYQKKTFLGFLLSNILEIHNI